MDLAESVILALLVAYLGVTGWALKALIDLRVDLRSHMRVEEMETSSFTKRLEGVENGMKDLVGRVEACVSAVLHIPSGAK